MGLAYDAPEPPADVFRDLLAIPSLSETVGTRSLDAALGQDAPTPRYGRHAVRNNGR